MDRRIWAYRWGSIGPNHRGEVHLFMQHENGDRSASETNPYFRKRGLDEIVLRKTEHIQESSDQMGPPIKINERYERRWGGENKKSDNWRFGFNPLFTRHSFLSYASLCCACGLFTFRFIADISWLLSPFGLPFRCSFIANVCAEVHRFLA